MPFRAQHLIDVTIDDAPTSQAANWAFGGATPTKACLYAQVVQTGTPTSIALTVEVSPDDGTTLITYDKLITDAGVDGPVSTVALHPGGAGNTLDDIIAFSLEDVFDFIRVTVTGVDTTAGNYYAVDVWVVWEF